MTESGTVLRVALGRKGHLGELYDARQEKFLRVSIFNSHELPVGVVKCEADTDIGTEFFSSDRISEKIEHFGAQGDLPLSLLANLIPTRGACDFLWEQKRSRRDVQCTLMQKIRTLDESFEPNDDRLRNYVNMDALTTEEATHIVVGINYGAITTVVVSHRSERPEDRGEVSRKMHSAIFHAVQEGKPGSSKVQLDPRVQAEENKILHELSVRVCADLLTNGVGALRDIENALKLVELMPTVVRKKGRGRQIAFHLMPIPEFARLFGVNVKLAYQEVSPKVVTEVENCIDSVNELLEELRDFWDVAIASKDIIAPNLTGEIRSLLRDCEVEYLEWKDRLRTTTLAVRGMEQDQEELLKLTKEVLMSNKIGHIYDFVKDPRIISRFELRVKLRNAGIETDGKKLQSVKDNSEKASYVLFCSLGRDHATDEFQKNLKVFISLAEAYRGSGGFIFIDEDSCPGVQEKEEVPPGLRICSIHRGKYNHTDVITVHNQRETLCTAKCDVGYEQKEKGPHTTPLKIPCPMSLAAHSCAGTPRLWHCYDCLSPMEYGFDGRFYCECGSREGEKYRFHCVDNRHGKAHVSYGEELRDELLKLSPPGERVILLIGEVGVGKSTWINAIADYITHDKWEEACEDRLINLVPTVITLSAEMEDGVKKINAAVGKSDNEVKTRPGQSVTQAPRSYLIHHGNQVFRIIDTPGIGDTRGFDYDKQNVERILAYIADLPEIHLICFVLLPDVQRLTMGFRICFKELIRQFHASVVENIVFAYTNSSTTGFKVGKTGAYLKEYLEMLHDKENVVVPWLSEHTEFVFDNTAYRCLCTRKIKIDPRFFKEFEDVAGLSYERSRKETLRLLEKATSVAGHNAKDTESLNYARNLALQLIAPLVGAVRNALSEEKRVDETEQKQINRALAVLSVFLMRNPITPFRDIAEHYLNALIENEKEKGDSVKQGFYEQMLENYRGEKQTITESSTAITTTHVLQVADEIQKLSKYGREIGVALQNVRERKKLDTPPDTYYAPKKRAP